MHSVIKPCLHTGTHKSTNCHKCVCLGTMIVLFSELYCPHSKLIIVGSNLTLFLYFHSLCLPGGVLHPQNLEILVVTNC